MTDITPLLGAVCTLALGTFWLIAPRKVARYLGIAPTGKLGISEVRATYGGIFVGLGAAALWFQQPEVYAAVGLAWLFSGLSRTGSVFLDRSFSGSNLGGIVIEVGIGLSLITGML